MPTSAIVGGPTYRVSATGGASGNPVIFSVDTSTTNQACSLGADGSTVSFAHAGTCVIDANQAGNSAYSAAPQAQQSFAVGTGYIHLPPPVSPRAPVVNFVSPNSAEAGDTVTISGANFTGKTAFFNSVTQVNVLPTGSQKLRFGYKVTSIPATATTVVSEGVINAEVPPAEGNESPGHRYSLHNPVFVTVGPPPPVDPATGQFKTGLISGSGILDNEAFYYRGHTIQVSGCAPVIPPILGNRCTTKRVVPAASRRSRRTR